MTEDAVGCYLFAVARGLDPQVFSGAAGLRGAALRVLEVEDLQAVVCAVPLAEFGEEGLKQHLEDLSWLEGVARRHNEVVWQVAEHATVAPMRLVTIYADDEGVRRRLAEHRDSLVAALDDVEGRREWSVKVYAATEQSSPEPSTVGSPAGSGAPGAGAAYLQRKRDAARQRRSASERSAALADEVHQVLGTHAVAARRLPPQDPRLTGRSEPMILNAAYLVPVDDSERFRAAVDELGDVGGTVSVELAGPWPPYSFTTLEGR